MKTLFIAVLAIIALSSFTAPKEETRNKDQTNITGVIKDAQTGETLAGVEVSIQGTDIKTYTNFDGEFSFDNIQPGDYKINTRLISYKNSQMKTISIENNQIHSLNVELQPESKELPVQAIANISNIKPDALDDFRQLATK